jgi:hypothetical protein
VIDDIEKLQRILIEEGLPQTERAYFGLKCPYCGKSDRIRELESPQSLAGALGSGTLSLYQGLWSRFEAPGCVLGVCKFCQNPLRILSSGAQAAVPLTGYVDSNP